MDTIPEPDPTFGQLLDWHLARGTRADGSPTEKGVPWDNKNFAKSVGSKSTEGAKSERTIRNWRNGATLPSPADFLAILLALFGGSQDYAQWKAELTDKYHAARSQVPDEPVSGPFLPSNSSIPTKPPRCMGRDDDVKSVVDALTASLGSTAILVLGGPGMGKTTLTREAANDPAVVERFHKRRWFVELETSTDTQIFETTVVKALGLDPAAAKFDDALALLEHAPGLLVLDNLETPWDGARDQTERLLARLHAVSTVALLASIRGNEPPSGLRWTRQRTIHPLEYPYDRDLFLDIAQDIKADDPHLELLLKELGGIPLAVELVAQQSAAHDTTSAIIDEWRRVGSALAKRRGVESSRLTSLEISLELSFNSQRLGDAGRRLFSILGQLPAGIGAEDLRALFQNSTFEAQHALLSCGLAFERDGRLDLLPPVRDHARRFHALAHVDAALWRNHFLILAREHGSRIGTTEGTGSMEWLSKELPNLEAALNAALLIGDLAEALSALQGMAVVAQFTGLGSPTAIRQLTSACRTAGNKSGEANCIESLGNIALTRSDHDAAHKAYEQATHLYRLTGDIAGQANCIQGLGDIALRRFNHDAAREAYKRALLLYRQIDNVLGEANCIQSLGTIALNRSDYNEGRKAFEQALALYQQIGAIQGEAACVSRLGETALARFEKDAARKAFEQALPLFRQIGDILGEANCIKGLGDVALQLCEHEAARKAYEQALPIYRQVGDTLGEANCIKNLGELALEGSDADTAHSSFLSALRLYEQIPDPYSAGLAHRNLARLSEGKDRMHHIAAARAAWASIGRADLVALLND
jgi:tetratricopeptide (TPR) repeat protein